MIAGKPVKGLVAPRPKAGTNPRSTHRSIVASSGPMFSRPARIESERRAGSALARGDFELLAVIFEPYDIRVRERRIAIERLKGYGRRAR
jgi:hypothetical protein